MVMLENLPDLSCAVHSSATTAQRAASASLSSPCEQVRLYVRSYDNAFLYGLAALLIAKRTKMRGSQLCKMRTCRFHGEQQPTI